jgi:hypothetical protein
LLARSAQALSLRQTRASSGTIKPSLLKALVKRLIPKPVSVAKASKRGKAKKKKKLERRLLTLMAGHFLNKKKPKAKKKKLPKVVSSSLRLLLEQAAGHLTPHLMWETLLAKSIKEVEAIALEKVKPLTIAMVQASQKAMDKHRAQALLFQFYRHIVRDTGKALKLKSLDRHIKPLPLFVKELPKTLMPAMSKRQAAVVVSALSAVFIKQISSVFGFPLARRVAVTLQFRFTQVSAAGLKTPVRKKAMPSRRVKPTSRPTSRPVVVGKVVPKKKATKQARLAIQPQKQPPVTALLARAYASVPSFPTLRPERVAFVKGGKRVGGWPGSLPIFAFGAFLAFIGLVVWRVALRAEVASRLANQQEDNSNPFVLLKQVIEPLATLEGDIDGLDNEALCDRVDVILETYVLPFAEVRQGIIEQLGMAEGAEILVTVAFGERMLNRVWSASSDGHVPEAIAVFPDAKAAFEEANELAQKALQSSRK